VLYGVSRHKLYSTKYYKALYYEAATTENAVEQYFLLLFYSYRKILIRVALVAVNTSATKCAVPLTNAG
jgi:hypothetical protein